MTNIEFKVSFEQHLQTKKLEMEQEEKMKLTPMVSQFGIDMKTFDWSDWKYIRSNVFDKILKFYINEFTDFICNELANKNEIFLTEVSNRTKDMLYKTNIGGKLNRGLLHILTFKLLREKKQKMKFTEIDAHNGIILCLMIEALQSYFLIMDDIMDESLTRRGMPCWYKQLNVGLKAINDGPILESWLFWLLHYRLISDKNIINLIDKLFRKVIIQTQFGQMIDLELTEDTNTLKQIYTIKRYETIAQYKTAYYTFYCPYAAALYLCGYNDTNITKDNMDLYLFYICEQLSIKMGIYFQIADDYLDVYGDYKHMGKIGTDIQDFKCSWMLIQAINLSNQKQYKLLKENYGNNDEKSIQKIKKLYKELNLKNVYHEWEENENKKLLQLIEKINVLPKEMFAIIIRKLYNRNK